MVKTKIRLKFAKKDDMRFISHLDLIRLFQRASRRADIPVTITQGFNPHPRISIIPAVKLGKACDSLEALFRVDGWMKPSEFKERLERQLPEGIEILDAEIC